MSAASSLIVTDQRALGTLLPSFDSPNEGEGGGVLCEGLSALLLRSLFSLYLFISF